MTWIVVLLRVVANPFSNVFQKVLAGRNAGPLFVILATHALLSLFCLPLCIRYGAALPRTFWVNMAICAALAVGANALIVQALKLSDLSILGPINAYKPVVSLIPGVFLLREMPSAAGLGGIVMIVAGSYFLADRNGGGNGVRGVFGRLWSDRGVQYRLGGLVLSAVEAVFLKKALLVSSPLITFIFWAMLGFAVSGGAMVVLGFGWMRDMRIFKGSLREYALLGMTTGVMQYFTLVSFEALQVGYALALFQTSAILSVILGHQFFQEREFAKRLVGSIVMVAGAALIVWRR